MKSIAISHSVLVLALASTACLDPQVSDDLGPHPDIRPRDAVVAPVEDDPVLRAQLLDADGLSGLIPLVNGFAAGAPTRTWDLGLAPDFAAPLFVLASPDADGVLVPLAHNTIIEAMPGDPGYSPYWAVFMVEVTARYAGEQLVSFDGVAAAVAAGLVLTPVSQQFAVNCPAVGPDVTLEVGTGRPPLPPPSRFYYRGRTVAYYDFGRMPLAADRVTVPRTPHYVLRREGGVPVSEPERGIDFVRDGDLTDTNDLFVHGALDPARSPHCDVIDVSVAGILAMIDTSENDATSDLRASGQLFTPSPVPGVVVAVQPRNVRHNCPAQRAPGAL